MADESRLELKRRAAQCVTHHRACDCREWQHYQVRNENVRLQSLAAEMEALLRVVHARWFPEDFPALLHEDPARPDDPEWEFWRRQGLAVTEAAALRDGRELPELATFRGRPEVEALWDQVYALRAENERLREHLRSLAQACMGCHGWGAVNGIPCGLCEGARSELRAGSEG